MDGKVGTGGEAAGWGERGFAGGSGGGPGERGAKSWEEI